MPAPKPKLWHLLRLLICLLAASLIAASCSTDADPDTTISPNDARDIAASDTRPDAPRHTDDASPDTSPTDTSPTDTSPTDTSPTDTSPTDTAKSDTAKSDTSHTGPPDTSAARFVDTQCHNRGLISDASDRRCADNVGCTEKSVVCGECVCVLCADEYCLEGVCDDGGSPECPGTPWLDDAG